MCFGMVCVDFVSVNFGLSCVCSFLSSLFYILYIYKIVNVLHISSPHKDAEFLQLQRILNPELEAYQMQGHV